MVHLKRPQAVGERPSLPARGLWRQLGGDEYLLARDLAVEDRSSHLTHSLKYMVAVSMWR
jgi:hypothetical protein